MGEAKEEGAHQHSLREGIDEGLVESGWQNVTVENVVERLVGEGSLSENRKTFRMRVQTGPTGQGNAPNKSLRGLKSYAARPNGQTFILALMLGEGQHLLSTTPTGHSNAHPRHPLHHPVLVQCRLPVLLWINRSLQTPRVGVRFQIFIRRAPHIPLAPTSTVAATARLLLSGAQ